MCFWGAPLSSRKGSGIRTLCNRVTVFILTGSLRVLDRWALTTQDGVRAAKGVAVTYSSSAWFGLRTVRPVVCLSVRAFTPLPTSLQPPPTLCQSPLPLVRCFHRSFPPSLCGERRETVSVHPYLQVVLSFCSGGCVIRCGNRTGQIFSPGVISL